MAAMPVAPFPDKEAFRPDEELFNVIEQFELLAGELAGDRGRLRVIQRRLDANGFGNAAHGACPD
jgi:hypothetical protein